MSAEDSTTEQGAQTGSSSGTTSAVVPTNCGNELLDRGEACDDGNQVDGDLCSSTCEVPFSEDWTFPSDVEFAVETRVLGAEVDADGNVVLVGDTIGPGGDRDVFLATVSPDGSLIWQTSIDVAGNDDMGRSVSIHPTGDFIVTGQTETSFDDSDAMVMRVDAETYDVEWVSTHDGPVSGTFFQNLDSFGRGVALLDGSVVAYGDQREPESASNSELILHRYDALGVEIWAETINIGPGNHTPAGLVALDDGTIVIHFTHLQPDKTFSGWLRSFSNDGVLLDSTQIDLQGDDLTADDEDGLYVVGTTVLDGDVRGFAAQFSPDFEEQWRFVAEFPDVRTSGMAIAVAPNGHVFVAGEALPSGQPRDIWVAEVDANGSGVWANTYGGEDTYEAGTDVVVGPDGDPVFIGVDASDPETSNVWIRKFDSVSE